MYYTLYLNFLVVFFSFILKHLLCILIMHIFLCFVPSAFFPFSVMILKAIKKLQVAGPANYHISYSRGPQTPGHGPLGRAIKMAGECAKLHLYMCRI